MNADLRKIRKIEEGPHLSAQQQYDQMRDNIRKLPLEEQSFAMAYLVTGLGVGGLAYSANGRPYLIDSDGVPPKPGEFE